MIDLCHQLITDLRVTNFHLHVYLIYPIGVLNQNTKKKQNLNWLDFYNYGNYLGTYAWDHNLSLFVTKECLHVPFPRISTTLSLKRNATFLHGFFPWPRVRVMWPWIMGNLHTLFSKRKATSKMLRFFWKRVYWFRLVAKSIFDKFCFIWILTGSKLNSGPFKLCQEFIEFTTCTLPILKLGQNLILTRSELK